MLLVPLWLQMCLAPALVSPINYITLPSLSFSSFQRFFFSSILLRTTVPNAFGISHILGMDSLWNQAHWEAFMPPATMYIPSNNQPTQPQIQLQLQPQPQLHAILPLGSKQNEARKYTAKDWDEQRLEITRLYENNTLNSVVEVMRERHGLDAT